MDPLPHPLSNSIPPITQYDSLHSLFPFAVFRPVKPVTHPEGETKKERQGVRSNVSTREIIASIRSTFTRWCRDHSVQSLWTLLTDSCPFHFISANWMRRARTGCTYTQTHILPLPLSLPLPIFLYTPPIRNKPQAESP